MGSTEGVAASERKRPRAVGAAEGLREGQVAKHLQRKK